MFRRNRAFFARARDEAYRQTYLRFQELQKALKNPLNQEKEALRSLDAFILSLEEVFDPASEAIRGLKRRHIRMYREDPEYGILEEEVVLCHFLEEMLSNTRFLRARLNTDFKLRLYRQRLSRIQAHAPVGDGFISRILETVDRFQGTEWVDIGKVLEMMDQRWQVGNSLFGVIRQKLGHWIKNPISLASESPPDGKIEA